MRTKPTHEEHRHTLQKFSSPQSVVSASSAVKVIRTGKFILCFLKHSMYAVLKSAMAVPEGRASPAYLKKFFKTFFPPFLSWSFFVFTKKEFFNKNGTCFIQKFLEQKILLFLKLKTSYFTSETPFSTCIKSPWK